MDLSTVKAIQGKAFFWGIRITLDLPTKQELQKLALLVAMGKLSPERLKAIVKRIKEKQAIQVILERITDYGSKREAALVMFKRTGSLKWFKQWLFYKQEFEKNSQSLAKIYLEKRKRLLAAERELRALFSKCADCGNSSKGSKYCNDCFRKRLDKITAKDESWKSARQGQRQ